MARGLITNRAYKDNIRDPRQIALVSGRKQMPRNTCPSTRLSDRWPPNCV